MCRLRWRRTVWKPGQSGYPGGVSRTSTAVATLARQYCVDAVEKLYEIMMRKSVKPRDAGYCAMLILSWGIGRPKQEVRLPIDDGAAARRPEVADPKERMREIAAALREAVRYREDIVDGLEKAPEAFIGMEEGRNFGV